MPKTLSIDDLPAEAQRVIEDIFDADEPITLSRNGELLGSLFAVRPDPRPYELTDEERADILAAVEQGEEDEAAGRYITLEELERKYADRLGMATE